MMTSLPPFGWSQVASKEDLVPLATRDDVRSLEGRLLVSIHKEFLTSTRWFVGILMIVVGAVVGSILGIK